MRFDSIGHYSTGLGGENVAAIDQQRLVGSCLATLIPAYSLCSPTLVCVCVCVCVGVEVCAVEYNRDVVYCGCPSVVSSG